MSQQTYSVREACQLLSLDAKTLHKRLGLLVPPATIMEDTKDKRIKRIYANDARRLAKEYGIVLGNPQEKIAPKLDDSDKIADLEQRIAALEAQIQQLLTRPARPAFDLEHRPAASPRPHHPPTAPKWPAGAPDGMLSVAAYAERHGIPAGTVDRAQRDHRITYYQENRLINGRLVTHWIDASMHATCFALWHRREDFTPCPDCPQEQR